MELLPRTTRAQAMDVLSSQADVAGYKAVLIAAEASPKFFPMLTTAAGTIRPSKVLIVGAGVAGLQAIATARRLGGQVEGFDVRPETKEQIQSLGAKYVELGVSAAGTGGYARELTAEERAQQQAALAEHIKGVDVIVTTAAVPGRKAPRIITAAMVGGMKAGAVIVDIAAETGGNCELTEAGKTVVTANGVTIIGPVNLAATTPIHASETVREESVQLPRTEHHEGRRTQSRLERRTDRQDLRDACGRDQARAHETTRRRAVFLACHSRERGNPVSLLFHTSLKSLDSRFRGNDGKKSGVTT